MIQKSLLLSLLLSCVTFGMKGGHKPHSIVMKLRNASQFERHSIVNDFRKETWKTEHKRKSFALSEEELIVQKNLIAPYFDEAYYIENYGKEVEESGMEAIEHYLRIGDFKNYRPVEWFQAEFYQKYFPCQENSLVDWLTQPSGVTQEKREEEVVITMTSYPPRIPTTWLAIESLLRQTEKADRFVLNLFEGEFPDRIIPNNIEIQKNRGVEINWCPENLKVFLKVIPALKKYPAAALAVFDDDVIYFNDKLTNLINKHNLFKNFVVYTDGRNLAWDKDRNLLPVNKWNLTGWHPNSQEENEERSDVIPEGIHGVLIPPNTVHEVFFEKNHFFKLTPFDDDLWLYACLIINNKQTIKIKRTNNLLTIPNSQKVGLWQQNCVNGLHNLSVQVANVFSFFSLYEKLNLKDTLLKDLIKYYPEHTINLFDVLAEKLFVYNFENEILLKRYGRQHDGGYVVPEIALQESDALLGYGIADDISFEEDFCNKWSKPAYGFDGGIENISIQNPLCKFIPEFLKTEHFMYGSHQSSGRTSTFSDQINKLNLVGKKKFIKMDIEGAEYEVFDDIEKDFLNITGMVLEVHYLHDIKYAKKAIELLSKINTHFFLAHLHGNNYTDCFFETKYSKERIPSVLELTYINKNFVTNAQKSLNQKHPTILDMPNCLARKDCTFNLIGNIL
jgi:hypothetical protein